MTEKKTIDITPVGMKTPEGVKRVNDALEKRNHIDYKCYMKLRKVIEVFWDREALIEMTRSGSRSGTAEKEATEFINSIDELIQQREDADNEFINAVAGRPRDEA